jgi:hypothetical protein
VEVKVKLVVARQVEMVVLAVAHLVLEAQQHRVKDLQVELDSLIAQPIGALAVAVALALWVRRQFLIKLEMAAREQLGQIADSPLQLPVLFHLQIHQMPISPVAVAVALMVELQVLAEPVVVAMAQAA